MSMRSEIEQGRTYRSPAGRELDLGALGRSLSERKRWLIGSALACCALAVLFVSVVEPRYTADAKVLIENGESYFTRPDKTDLQQTPLPDDEAIQSQVQLISSRDIAREAIKRLDLKGNPEFDPLAKGLNPFSRLLILLGLERDPTTLSPEDRILHTYYDRLTVFPVVKSRVITIEFSATDPDLAARAANTIADLYIEAQSDAKRDSARAAADSLATLITDLRTRVADAESKADAFRTRSGLLVGTNNNTITAQQLGDITTQLAQARTAEADAEAKAKLIRDMIRQGRIGEVPDVANNELIRRISEQRVNLRAEIALQSRTLLPGHPHMQELNAQLQDVDAQLRSAGEKAVRTLENDARIAAGRVDNLSAALDAQKKTASTAGADQVQLNTLESQARLLKDQLEFNTAKYQEAVARENAVSAPADARVISRADPPQLPSFPKKLPIIAIATLAGLVLALGVLIARELLSGRAFGADDEMDPPLPQQVDYRPGLEQPAPVAAAAPGVARPLVGTTKDDSGDIVSRLQELRSRKSGVLAMRILLCAPREPAEASPVAMTLARRLAGTARTILVDFDRGAPAVRGLSVAGASSGEAARDLPGLSELLAGDATFAEIIHRDALSRVHVVPVGNGDLATADEAEFGLVLEALAETYDFVLMNAPSPKSDITRALCKAADVAILVEAEQHGAVDVAAASDELEKLCQAPIFTVRASELAIPGAVRDAA